MQRAHTQTWVVVLLHKPHNTMKNLQRELSQEMCSRERNVLNPLGVNRSTAYHSVVCQLLLNRYSGVEAINAKNDCSPAAYWILTGQISGVT